MSERVNDREDATCRLLVVLAVAAASLLTSCGHRDTSGTGAENTTTIAQPRASKPAAEHARGPRGKAACRALRAADVRPVLAAAGATGLGALRRTGRASYELSDCRFQARGLAAWVTIDRAVDAGRRYWYRVTEQQEFHAADPARRPKLVKGVGQDLAYGGAGAFWTPSLNRLVAYRDRTMLIIGFSVKGSTDAARRRGATQLAKLTYRRLFGKRPPHAPERFPVAPHP